MLPATAQCRSAEASHPAVANDADEARGRDAEFRSLLLVEVPSLSVRASFLEREPAAADDLVQDTLERALRNQGRFTRGSNLRRWLLCIMQNLFTDRWRARVHLCYPTEIESQAEELPEGIGQRLSEVATIDDVRVALSELAEPLRTAFGLRFFEGLSYQELATQTHVPVATVGTRLLRARARLRAMLSERFAERVDTARLFSG